MKEKSGISLGSRRTISELTEVSVDSKMVVKSPKKTMTHRKKRVEKLTDSPQNSLLQTLKPHSGAKNVNKRPCRSYTSLIEEAILKSPGRRLILRDIYRYFEDSYPYFKESKTGWKVSCFF